MERLHRNPLPELSTNLFQSQPNHLKLLHINIGNIHQKIVDMKCDQIIKLADILCINETHLSTTDQLQCDMLNLEQDMEIYQKDRNNNGGGVAVLIHKKLKPQEVSIETTCELVAVKISAPQDIILISVYRPPSFSICTFSKEMDQIIRLFEGIDMCVIGDMNEDVLNTKNTTCCSVFKSRGLHQIVTKPTHDSRTLIDHVYTTKTLRAKSDVTDCYYSDHDFVLVNIN